jgi:hypothetical protein
MKVPLPNDLPLDLDAPTLSAYARNMNGIKRLVVWCKYCQVWHSHGQEEGHREARCSEETPYMTTGYNLALAGRWQWRMKDGPLTE